MNLQESKKSNEINRKEFISMIAKITPSLLITPSILMLSNELSASANISNKSLEDLVKNRNNIYAITRALASPPPNSFKDSNGNSHSVPIGDAFFQKSIEAYIILDHIAKTGKLLPSGEFETRILSPNPLAGLKLLTTLVPVDINVTKQALEMTSLTLQGLALDMPKMAGALGRTAVATSAISVLLPSDNIIKTIRDNALGVTHVLWSDLESKKLMTKEIINVMDGYFRINFEESARQNIEKLSKEIKSGNTEVKEYMNSILLAFEKNQNERLDDIQDEIIKTVSSSINNSINKLVQAMDQNERERAESELRQQYDAGELHGKIFLAGYVAGFIGTEAGIIVKGIGEAGLKTMSLVKGFGKRIGPFAAFEGLVGIAQGLSNLFGKSSDQVILDSLSQLQNTVSMMRQEMQNLFKVVIINQEKMYDALHNEIESLKTQGRNFHKAEMKVLQSISDKVDYIRIRQGDNGRTLALEKFYSIHSSLLTQKGKSKDKQDDSIIDIIFQDLDIYANNTAKYGDFTGLPNMKGREDTFVWDPPSIIKALDPKTIESVDFHVGLIPIMIKYFKNTNNIDPVYNPIELGRTAQELSLVMQTFPNVLIGNQEHQNRVRKIDKAIRGTNNSIQEITGYKTVLIMKNHYLKALNQLLDNLIDSSYNQAYSESGIPQIIDSKPNKPSIFLSDNQIVVESKDYQYIGTSNDPGKLDIIKGNRELNKNDVPSISQIPDNSILLHDESFPSTKEKWDLIEEKVNLGDFERDYVLSLVSARAGWSYLGTYNIVMAKNVRGIGEIPTSDMSSILELAANLGVFKIIKVDIPERDIYYPNNPLGLIAKEKSISISMVLPDKDGKKQTWAPYSNSNELKWDPLTQRGGWIISTITEKGTGPNGTDVIRHIQYNGTSYYSRENPYYKEYSMGFIKKLVDEKINPIRKKLTEDCIKYLKENSESDIALEFEAIATCIRYIAGFNAYVRNNNLALGTAIAKGENIVIRSNEKTSEEMIVELTSTREELSDFVKKILDPKYIIAKCGEGYNSEISSYVRNEIYNKFANQLNDFINSHFRPQLNKYNLPDLTLSHLILASEAKKHGIKLMK